VTRLRYTAHVANPRQRPIVFAAGALVLAWLLAVGGYFVAKNSKMTAAKVRAYAQSVDFSQLTGEARTRAIRELAEKLNRLSPEERRQARLERVWASWFERMTEEERALFIELTMPTGLKQMLTAFEELAPERRKRTIDEALKRLREARDAMEQSGEAPNFGGANGPPVLTAELQEKITKTGLKTFYSESSAQMKAELAPVLEELQRLMQSGAAFRGRR